MRLNSTSITLMALTIIKLAMTSNITARSLYSGGFLVSNFKAEHIPYTYDSRASFTLYSPVSGRSEHECRGRATTTSGTTLLSNITGTCINSPAQDFSLTRQHDHWVLDIHQINPTGSYTTGSYTFPREDTGFVEAPPGSGTLWETLDAKEGMFKVKGNTIGKKMMKREVDNPPKKATFKITNWVAEHIPQSAEARIFFTISAPVPGLNLPETKCSTTLLSATPNGLPYVPPTSCEDWRIFFSFFKRKPEGAPFGPPVGPRYLQISFTEEMDGAQWNGGFAFGKDMVEWRESPKGSGLVWEVLSVEGDAFGVEMVRL